MSPIGWIPPFGFRDHPRPPLAPGAVIASCYMVREEITRTETGCVFEAFDMTLERSVALKIGWRDPELPSLVIEARRCASIKDPCAVEIHAMGRHDGVEFVVAERVTGSLMRDVIEPAPVELYVTWLRTLAAAVAKAHDAHIAIGDISGDTVLLAADGRIVLGRLSLSQVPAFGPHGQTFAPEIARGDVDPADPGAAEAIDVHNLGCAAIELASGQRPFADLDREREALRYASEIPPRLTDLRPDLPDELSDLVDWMVAKQPAGRPRSVNDVLSQLDAVIERLGTVSRTIRVMIVGHDMPRARWLWSLARRAHPGAIVEIASEGSEAAHKLNHDQPDLVFVDAALRGVMNALELCMYARGIEGVQRAQMYMIGTASESDRALFANIHVPFIPEDGELPATILERVRAMVSEPPRRRRARITISG